MRAQRTGAVAQTAEAAARDAAKCRFESCRRHCPPQAHRTERSTEHTPRLGSPNGRGGRLRSGLLQVRLLPESLTCHRTMPRSSMDQSAMLRTWRLQVRILPGQLNTTMVRCQSGRMDWSATPVRTRATQVQILPGPLNHPGSVAQLAGQASHERPGRKAICGFNSRRSHSRHRAGVRAVEGRCL